MKTGIYKVTRVLEHVGPQEWLDETLAKRGVVGRRAMYRNDAYIQEVSISEPELVRDETQEEIVERVRTLLGKLTGESLSEIERDWFSYEDKS